MGFKCTYIPLTLVEEDLIDSSGYIWWLLWLTFDTPGSTRKRIKTRREPIPMPIGPCSFLRKVKQ